MKALCRDLMRTLLMTILAAGSLAAQLAEDASDLLQHVNFQSSNFETNLTWDSGTENAVDTVYSVEYKEYGEKDWLIKKGCQQITRKFCNLTKETSEFRKPYYAKVTAISTGGRSVSKMTPRFISLAQTNINPPDVTCIPKVRSIQMVVHPSFTPVHSGVKQLTLEDIYDDLCYHLELSVNHTYKMTQSLEGKQREYEFTELTPDTEFSGTVTIMVPSLSKKSSPYVCRVKTLPDPAWTYSFSGAFLFFMGFLVAVLCYLSYRYVTKPPSPPNSLNIQPVLTFQPLRFIQEHVLIPVFELSSSSNLAQPVQYSQVQVSLPREPLGAPQLHSLSETTYLGQLDSSILQPARMPPHQTLSSLSYAPQAATEVSPPSYAPQVTSKAKPSFYKPQPHPEVQPPSYMPQATLDTWPPSYGVCMEGSGTDSPPMTLCSPKHLGSEGQLLQEAPAGSYVPGGPSLKEVSYLASEELQEAKFSYRHLESHKDPNLLHREDPGTPDYLKGQLPLLSSVQIEGQPMSLLPQTASLPCSPTNQGPSSWGLLDSIMCPKDEGLVSETKAKSLDCQDSEVEPQAEVDFVFRDLALTVQWES
ncbi:interleukin-22 receptor subunit alpha-1 [Erinaceus europaeus]|uniref:Interleukin-22 receptor subunit alpha-1 n=1 Tax=Erinaceus europaeus TaxID=9365 RepID=A0ABM3YKD3_ERIEU|nr:interleukin-22 receptor subunit alpha-1 [Erinaceus europaeus]